MSQAKDNYLEACKNTHLWNRFQSAAFEYIKELEDQLKWIDVDDQLPDANKDVLIELNGGVVLFGYYKEGFWFINRPYSEGYKKVIYNKVINWKPIPKPSMEGIIK